MFQSHHKKMLPLAMLLYGCTVYAGPISPSSQDANIYKNSWLATALKLQSEIDLYVPLNEATFIGTHNSYNASHYATPLRYLDPNQTLSIYDQLEAGVRSIELDAHWTMNSRAAKAILLCHGQDNHLGCSIFDRSMSEGLEEIRNWLKANPKEIVLLYIERHLDKHEPRLAAMLEEYLGPFIYKASLARKNGDKPKGCVALPSALTKDAILKAGKQLIIVTKNCDGSSVRYEEEDKFSQHWNDYVFAGIGDIPSRPYTFIDSTMNAFTAYPDCGKSTVFQDDNNHVSMWRIFEDRTRLSSIERPQRKLQPEDMQELMRCGINWPTMDMLTAADPRLVAAIWSWAPSYPQESKGQCAIYKKDSGIQNIPCEQMVAGYACREKNTNELKAVSLIGPWSSGESTCQLSAGKNWHFATPINGYQMNSLKESMGTLMLTEVGLNYSADKNGHWVAKN